MQTKPRIWLWLVAMLLTLTGFATASSPVYAQSDHCGTISADEVWDSATIHIISCNVTIADDATLTIQPGSILKFHEYQQLIVNGTLLAAGTSSQPIYFTSIHDVNVDDYTDDAAVGDWGNIKFKSGSDGVISRAIIQYSGRDSGFNGSGVINDAPIVITNSSPTLSHISFVDNLYNAALLDAGGDWIVTGNSDRWSNSTVVYVVDKSNIVIPEGQAVFIDKGVKIKMGKSRSIEVYGFLNMAGTSSVPVTLTSLQDDTVCGTGARNEPVCDSNNDGDSTSPALGDWGNIQFTPDSDDDSIITRASIHYSGSVSGNQVRDGAISLENASPSLSYISFGNNYINGAYLSSGIDWFTDAWNSPTVVYVLDKLDLGIPNNHTLTIAPDAKIKLGNDVSIDVRGTLTANGTADAQIVFSSLLDDTVCGIGADNQPVCDTNGDGEATNPNVGDWGNIQFHPESNDASSISYARFSYSGSDSGNNVDDGPIWLENASPRLAHISFDQNYINGVELSAGMEWQSDTWDNHTVVHVIEDGDILIPADATLTITPGLTLKLDDDNSFLVEGQIHAVGTESQLILFTSIHDDSGCGTGLGGETICDTYGDGTTALPETGDWGYIHFGPSSDDASIISRAAVRYSGSNLGIDINDGAIYLDNASPTLANISFSQNYINGAELRGRVDWTTTTLANTSVIYVLEEGDITIPFSSTLAIGAGAGIKLGNYSSINIDGGLLATGSQSQPITLTSLHDDSLCGSGANNEEVCESYGVSPSTEPIRGDWGKIDFREPGQSDSAISYAVIRYAGTNNDRNDNATILLRNSTPLLSFISFRDNAVNGVNVSTDSDLPWQPQQWANSSVVYVVQEGDVTVPVNEELIIGQGVKIKLDINSSFLVDGQLVVAGTFDNPVYFTSLKDDAICGVGAFGEEICDTNGDASLNGTSNSGENLQAASTPAIGDWGHIRFGNTSTSASTIERAIIRYSGNDSGIELNDSAIMLNGASPAVLYSVLTQNYRGIEAQDGASPSLTCNDIYDNQDYGIFNGTDLSDQSGSIVNSDIAEGVVVARRHWWGASSGPSHGSNGNGTGESVSDNVEFTPWEGGSCMLQEDPDRQAPILESELAIEVALGPDTTSSGAIMQFAIQASNVGPENATGVQINITLPEQGSLTSASFPGGNCSSAGNGVLCEIGNLAVGRQVEITLIVSADAVLSTDLNLSTSVNGNELDPSMANNSAVHVIALADDQDELYLPFVAR